MRCSCQALSARRAASLAASTFIPQGVTVAYLLINVLDTPMRSPLGTETKRVRSADEYG